MNRRPEAWKTEARNDLRGALRSTATERRRSNGRRITDGVIRIGTTLARAIDQARRRAAGDAANDPTFQDQPIRARSGVKLRANVTGFRALLRKLHRHPARAASPALAQVSGLLADLLWSVKMITSPQPPAHAASSFR